MVFGSGFVGARKRFGYGKKIAGAGSRSGDRSESADARHNASRQVCGPSEARVFVAPGLLSSGIGLSLLSGFY